MPHSRADVEVLPDVEEVQERMEMAMQLVDACSGVSEAPLSAIMQAAETAATAAASASTLVSLFEAGSVFRMRVRRLRGAHSIRVCGVMVWLHTISQCAMAAYAPPTSDGVGVKGHMHFCQSQSPNRMPMSVQRRDALTPAQARLNADSLPSSSHPDGSVYPPQAWCDYEVAKLRELSSAQGQEQAPEEASPSAKQMFDRSKLVWRHILASLNGLKSGLKLGVNVGQDEIAGLPHLTAEGACPPLAVSHPSTSIEFHAALKAVACSQA